MTAVFSSGFFRLNSFPRKAAAAIEAGTSSGSSEAGWVRCVRTTERGVVSRGPANRGKVTRGVVTRTTPAPGSGIAQPFQ